MTSTSHSKIDSKDISVIVQGAIVKEHTRLCLKSVRKNLPKAEIILSTWSGSQTSNLEYDVLVLSDDPKGEKHDYTHNNVNNTNRQLVSVQNALKKCSRQFCLKLRSDAFLRSSQFLSYWDKFQARDSSYSIFENKLLNDSVYSREGSGGSGLPTPFHPSDFWYFGLTSDLRKYFLSTQLMSPKELADWSFKYPNRLPYNTCLWRYSPEQYYLVSYLKNVLKLNFQFDDWSDWSPENINLSQKILYNNFIFLEESQSGITNYKHSWAVKHSNCIEHLITHDLFQKRYKEFCDSSYLIQETETLYKTLYKTLYNYRHFIPNFIKYLAKLFFTIIGKILYSIQKYVLDP